MKRAILVLQYPDSRQGRTVAVAATRSAEALWAFKKAVLEEARLICMDWDVDEVLGVQDKMELERLEKILDLLIPAEEQGEESGIE